jgi:hypothetical protein
LPACPPGDPVDVDVEELDLGKEPVEVLPAIIKLAWATVITIYSKPLLLLASYCHINVSAPWPPQASDGLMPGPYV